MSTSQNMTGTAIKVKPITAVPQETSTYILDEYQPKVIDEYELDDRANRQKIFDEFIAACKEDRNTTKRVISADIASRNRVQSQNETTIAACERELRKQGLSEEYRSQLFQTMNDARQSSVDADRESREFEQQELRRMHALPWIIVGGAGGTAGLWVLAKFIRAVA